MVEPDAVLEFAGDILYLGVATMVGLEFQGVAVPVGDEGVIAVGGEQGQLRAERGLHPTDDEPHWRGAGLALKGCNWSSKRRRRRPSNKGPASSLPRVWPR